jgi:hypothetical protein
MINVQLEVDSATNEHNNTDGRRPRRGVSQLL